MNRKVFFNHLNNVIRTFSGVESDQTLEQIHTEFEKRLRKELKIQTPKATKKKSYPKQKRKIGVTEE